MPIRAPRRQNCAGQFGQTDELDFFTSTTWISNLLFLYARPSFSLQEFFALCESILGFSVLHE
jgi:hypothetical protein